MITLRTSLVLCAVAVVTGSCQVLNYTWATPPAVAAGSTFVMELTGATNDIPGPAGVVFQMPIGFTVLGAAVVLPNFTLIPDLVRDEPALLTAYTPDPGHYLASFSGIALLVQVPQIDVHLQVFVQAPPAGGAFQLEMALACEGGPWLPQLGLNSFQTPGGAAVRQIQVTASPPAPPFTLAAGLFDVPPSEVLDLEAADIDGDGRDDLVEVGVNSFRVRRSLPTGLAPPGAPYVASGNIYDAAVADFDGDGFADVALSNGTVAFGDGGTAWTNVLAASHGMSAAAVAAGDVDGDGLADVAFTDVQAVVVVRGQPNRTFLPWSTGLPSVPSLGTPGVLFAVDLDNDGRAELVRKQHGFSGTHVFGSTPQGTWSLVGSLPPSHQVLAIDIDGDGTRELLPGGSSQLFHYSPQGLTGSAFAGPATPFMRALAIDHDRDGRDDMVLGVAGGTIAVPRLELWRNAGGGSFTAVPLATSDGFRVLRAFTLLIAADFDDDTFPDLAAAIDRVLLWRNTQHGAAAFGGGCAAPGGTVPGLDVLGTLGSGLPATLQVSGVAPGAITLMWLGNSRTSWNGAPVLPLDLGSVGAPGCTLLAEPIQLVAVPADAAGIATLPFQVPLLPPALPISLFGQAAVLDAMANPLGGVFSRGVALKLQ